MNKIIFLFYNDLSFDIHLKSISTKLLVQNSREDSINSIQRAFLNKHPYMQNDLEINLFQENLCSFLPKNYIHTYGLWSFLETFVNNESIFNKDYIFSLLNYEEDLLFRLTEVRDVTHLNGNKAYVCIFTGY